MISNNESIDIKYLIANDCDHQWGLTVNSVGFQEIKPGSEYPLKNHPSGYYFNYSKGRILREYQLVYITRGHGVFKCEDIPETQISQGSLFLLYPGKWHTYHPDIKSGWNEYYIGFSGSIIDNLVVSGFLDPATPILNIGLSERLVRLYKEAIETAKADKSGAQQLLAGVVMHILGIALSISRNKVFETDEIDQKIERAKIIMRESIMQDVDLEELASKLNLSYSWFRKVFKDYTGFAPAKYFQELKIQKAKELLTHTAKPVKEISIMLNYESTEHFSTLFKKKTGFTPLEYRHHGRENSNQ
jgi:AraC-type DNA-binding domain-containing proteins